MVLTFEEEQFIKNKHKQEGLDLKSINKIIKEIQKNDNMEFIRYNNPNTLSNLRPKFYKKL